MIALYIDGYINSYDAMNIFNNIIHNMLHIMPYINYPTSYTYLCIDILKVQRLNINIIKNTVFQLYNKDNCH